MLDHLAEIGVKRVEWVLFTHHHCEQCQGAPKLQGRGVKLSVNYDNAPAESSPKKVSLLLTRARGGRLGSKEMGLAGANSLRCPPATGGHLSSYKP